MGEKLRTTRQTADELSVNPEQVRRLVKDGDLRAINVGRSGKRERLRFDDEDIAAFKRRRQAQRDSITCPPSTKTSGQNTTRPTSQDQQLAFIAQQRKRALPRNNHRRQPNRKRPEGRHRAIAAAGKFSLNTRHGRGALYDRCRRPPRGRRGRDHPIQGRAGGEVLHRHLWRKRLARRHRSRQATRLLNWRRSHHHAMPRAARSDQAIGWSRSDKTVLDCRHTINDTTDN